MCIFGSSLALQQKKLILRWNLKNIKTKKMIEKSIGPTDHFLRVHQDGLIVTGDRHNNNYNLKVFSSETGKHLHTLIGHTDWARGLSISKDAKRAVSTSFDRQILVWNLQNGTLKHTMEGHSDLIRCLTISGKIAISASRDKTIRLWDLESGTLIRVLTGHNAGVNCIKVKEDLIASADIKGFVKLWKVSTGDCVQTVRAGKKRITSLLFNHSKDMLFVGNEIGEVYIFKISTGELKHKMTGHEKSINQLFLNENLLISTSWDAVKIWDISRIDSCIKDRILRHSISLSGKSLLPVGGILSNGWFLAITSRSEISMVDANSGKVVRIYPIDRCSELYLFPNHFVAQTKEPGLLRKRKVIIVDFDRDENDNFDILFS